MTEHAGKVAAPVTSTARSPDTQKPTRSHPVAPSARGLTERVFRQAMGDAPIEAGEREDEIGAKAHALGVQPKLSISQPGDPDELEADRVADRIMTSAESESGTTASESNDEEKVQRKPLPGAGHAIVARTLGLRGAGQPLGSPHIARDVDDGSGDATDLATVSPAELLAPKGQARVGGASANAEDVQEYLDASRGHGASLPKTARKEFENQFQHSFADVSIHHDSAADVAAKSIDALAFTRGTDIYFRTGSYDPSSPAGKRLLAHELTHVAQQRPAVSRQAISGAGAATPGAPPVSTPAVDKALRTKDAGDVKAIDKKEIYGLPVDKKMELVRILAYQGWVGPFDELKIEEIWGTLTTEELVRTGSLEVVMYNHCISVGAELDRLPNVKLMASAFISDVRSIALSYLKQNAELVTSEMVSLGIPARADETAAPPTEEQSQKVAATQRAAASVADLQEQMKAARNVPVGYKPKSYVPTFGKSTGSSGPQGIGGFAGVPAPSEQADYADVCLFEPGKPPPFANADLATAAGYKLIHPPVPTKDFETLDTLFAQSSSNVAALLGHFPALMALSKTGKSEDVGGLATEADPAAARARLGAAMRAVKDNIAKAQTDLDIASRAIDPLDLQPIHRQMFQRQVIAAGKGEGVYDWTQSLPKLVAEQAIGDHEFGKVLGHMGLSTLSAAAFLVAPFTGGASLAVVLAAGVGAAAANAVISNEEYDRLLSLSRATVKPGTELVNEGQVTAAKAQKDADETELAMALLTAATLGLGQVGRYKTLAKAIETATDAVGLAEISMELLTEELNNNVRMYGEAVELPDPSGGVPVQRVQRTADRMWADFEVYAAGELQRGPVGEIPQMDIVVEGIHNAKNNGIDRIGLRRNKSGKIEIWHFEVKWNYLQTTNPDPKLWERGGKMQFNKAWEADAIEKLCKSTHPGAQAARNEIRKYIATSTGRSVGKVPPSEVLALLRNPARGRAVIIREGFVPVTLLEQLARMLRRGRRIRLGKLKLPP